MWTTRYIISQILVVIGMGLMAVSYQTKNKTLLLLFSSLSALLYGAHYFLIGAMSAVAMNVVALIRGFVINYFDKKGKSNSIWLIGSFILFFIVAGAVTMTRWFDILAIMASTIYTASLYGVNIKVYRWMSIGVSACWLSFSILSKTVFGAITETILLTMEIIGIVRLYKGQKIEA